MCNCGSGTTNSLAWHNNSKRSGHQRRLADGTTFQFFLDAVSQQEKSLWSCTLRLRNIRKGIILQDLLARFTLLGPDFRKGDGYGRYTLKPASKILVPFDSLSVRLIVDRAEGCDDRVDYTFLVTAVTRICTFQSSQVLRGMTNLWAKAQGSGEAPVTTEVIYTCDDYEKDGKTEKMCYKETCEVNSNGSRTCSEREVIPGTEGCVC